MGPRLVKSTSNFIIRVSRAIFSVFNSLLALTMISKSEIGGVILAGGKASRMDFRDKALVPLHGKPLLDYVVSKAAAQVKKLVLSVNHNIERYQVFELPIVSDRDASYAGPLLGILSAMHWFRNAQANKGIHYLACFPGDVPEFPHDVVGQLAQELNKQSAAVAYVYHRDQIQPLFSLWHLDLIEQIEAAVAAGLYGPKLLFGSLKAVAVNCDDNSPGTFCNINSAEDLNAAAALIARK
ncbi:MAG: molybdenum cofactor guanylyltransferase [SAR86 cluster bacterium]|uniref:Molybdenum cofactor guanylyltransferase n=1 Tax=SAR86 cluster bacterium TaxID=2030880 RepID=A0A2A4WUZ5_9GAMM|nr:MAG: molybdenum cofactor guanylyltransferase [SAR86 cluster bacterium]